MREAVIVGAARTAIARERGIPDKACHFTFF